MTDEDARHRALMGSLTAGVTHELSNPLAYMLANIDYVLAELARGASSPATLDECARALTQVKTGTLQLRALTRGLRALAQPTGYVTTLSLSQVIEHALLVTRGTWKHSATVEVDVLAARHVVGDEALVMRWLTRRLLDTLQGLAVLEAPRIVVRTALDGERLLLSVDAGLPLDGAAPSETEPLVLTVARE